MKRLAMWIVNNIPCGRLAPILFGYAIGAKYSKTLEPTNTTEPKTKTE